MNLSQKYFKAIGWKIRGCGGSTYGRFVATLPDIEHDCNEFKKWVVDEMRERGYFIDLWNKPKDGFWWTVGFWSIEDESEGYEVMTVFNSYQFAGIQAAIKILEDAK